MDPIYKVAFSIALIGGFGLFVVLSKDGIKSLFVPTVKFDDKQQNIPWSSVDHIHLYVPKCELAVFPSPLLACESAHLSTNHVSWECEDFEKASIYNDAQELIQQLGVDATKGQVFSTVTQQAVSGASKGRKISIDGTTTDNPLALEVAESHTQVV
jgi:hypothetical protein